MDLSQSKNCAGSHHSAKHQCSVLCLIAPVSCFIGQKPASKNLNVREEPKHIHWEVCMKWSTGSTERLSLALFPLFDPLPFSRPFTTRHTNPCHNSLRVIFSVPADEKKHYPVIWSRSSRSFITQSRIIERLLTTFSLLVRRVYNYIMQIFYVFLCNLFFFPSQSLLSCFPFAHLSFADHRGQTD